MGGIHFASWLKEIIQSGKERMSPHHHTIVRMNRRNVAVGFG
jgi:hypothetical protein